MALLSNNALEHLLIYFGVMYYGATICTIHVEMNAVIIKEILKSLDPKLVLFEEGLGLEEEISRSDYPARALGSWSQQNCTGFVAEISGLSAENPAPVYCPDDIATIFFTSGTTAEPKGILCSFRHLETNVAAVLEAFGIRAQDRLLDYRSFNWASAQMLSALGALCQGATLIMPRKFSGSRFFEWIKTYKPTVVAGNPTVFNMLLAKNSRHAASHLSSIRFMTSSSAALSVADWKRFEEQYGVPIVQGYGTSEAGWIGAASLEDRRMGSVGRPLAYHKLEIVSDGGAALPICEIGHIEVGAEPSREFGYLTGDGSIKVTHVGRFRTGDMGYLDEDGFLFITGRSKDLIIRGGVNISPMEIDLVINQLPGVSEAASVGVPDKIYGEEVVAFVAIADGASLDAETIRLHCQDQLVELKTPKSIYIVDVLPRTERGKLDRKELKNLWLEMGNKKGS